MNDLAKYAWYIFFAALGFGIWVIPMLAVWAIGCYIYHRWKYEHLHRNNESVKK